MRTRLLRPIQSFSFIARRNSGSHASREIFGKYCDLLAGGRSFRPCRISFEERGNWRLSLLGAVRCSAPRIELEFEFGALGVVFEGRACFVLWNLAFRGRQGRNFEGKLCEMCGNIVGKS